MNTLGSRSVFVL